MLLSLRVPCREQVWSRWHRTRHAI